MSTKTEKLGKNLDQLLDKADEINAKLEQANLLLVAEKSKAGSAVVAGSGNMDQMSGQVAKLQGQVAVLEAAKTAVDDQLAVARSELWESERSDAADRIRELDQLSDELENEIIGLLETVADKGQSLLDMVEEYENLESRYDVHPGYNNSRSIAGGFKASALAAIQEHGYRRDMRTKALAGELQ